MNDGWKLLIDHECGTDGSNFFTFHHKTYGNFHWVSSRLGAIAIVCMCISYIFWIIGIVSINTSLIDLPHDFEGYGSFSFIRIATVTDLVLVLIPCLCMLTMYFRTPAFYDYFSVRHELKLTFIILCVYYIAVVFTQLELVWLQLFEVGGVGSRWYALTHTAITIVCEFAIILIQTFWVAQKLAPYLELKFERTKSKVQMKDIVLRASQHNDDIEQDNNNGDWTPDDNAGADNVQQQKNAISMHDILSRNESFTAFTFHIVKEFSVEILVSYVEFTQLLQYLFTNYDEMISVQVHDSEVDDILIDLPSTAPLSYIIKTATNGELAANKKRTSVFGGSAKRETKESPTEQRGLVPQRNKNDVKLLVLFIGSSLYNKYVKKNAELEINISSGLRKKFMALFTRKSHNDQDQDVELELDDVVQLFVDANKAMHRLLSYSFARFKTKKDFHRMLESSQRKSLSIAARVSVGSEHKVSA
eukprot:CAMPEP_0202716830 /NCGR_PEP_ID=MMETSP1385-20130828/105393_1 /ASSEMBLY_ACC=CAM_ASM_000861 /TAXON_ID=933848 /ORGANISM="Elphidium margaritaceum" /LENGTH=473 /DNA_ID=CAMNT_0049378763 /DNA_START=369 /DNA_END=1790 /DNA_ORIENTATION=+